MPTLNTVTIDRAPDDLDAGIIVGILTDLDGHAPFIGADPAGNAPAVIVCADTCAPAAIAAAAERHGLTPGSADAIDAHAYDVATCPNEESVRTITATARGEVPDHITATPEPEPEPKAGDVG